MHWERPPPPVTEKNQQRGLTVHVKALHDNRQLHLTGHVSQGAHCHAQLLLGYKAIPIPVQHPESFTDFCKREGRRGELLWWRTPWSMHLHTWDTEAAYIAFSNVNDAYLIISSQCNRDMFIHTYILMCMQSCMHASVCRQINTTASTLMLPIFCAKYHCKIIYSLHIELHFFLQHLPRTAVGEPS